MSLLATNREHLPMEMISPWHLIIWKQCQILFPISDYSTPSFWVRAGETVLSTFNSWYPVGDQQVTDLGWQSSCQDCEVQTPFCPEVLDVTYMRFHTRLRITYTKITSLPIDSYNFIIEVLQWIWSFPQNLLVS